MTLSSHALRGARLCHGAARGELLQKGSKLLVVELYRNSHEEERNIEGWLWPIERGAGGHKGLGTSLVPEW